MPPKTGKRKVGGKKVAGKKGAATKKAANTAPDRLTWPGWVEMESEPAFFNVMLKDMGVRGVKVNEVYDMDDNAMAMLPKPVHALIFLFRYQSTDKTKLETECPKQVWYAEQVPDFACATFALLNIINNIPGLEMGQQLRAFKQRTQDMTPRLRGDAVDEFTFVKQIHNSFARDEDLLNADAHMKEKLTRTRKEQAVAKAKKTKAANAAARAAKANPPEKEVSKPARIIKRPSEEQFAKGTRAPRSSPSDEETAKSSPAAKSSRSTETPKEESPKGTRTSKRNKKPTIKAAEASPPSKVKASKSPVTKPDSKLSNGDATPKKVTKTPDTTPKKEIESPKTTPKKENETPDTTPTKTNGATTLDKHTSISSSSSTSSKRKSTFEDRDDEVAEKTTEKDNEVSATATSKAKATANANKKLKLNGPKRNATSDPDADFATATVPATDEQATCQTQPRRSGREHKPRKDLLPAAVQKEKEESAADEAQAFDEEGFHFCAYMPIGDRVWKLDGMDGFPQDMGPIEDGVDWLDIAKPALEERMAQYVVGAIEFNLMAVVHDPMVACTNALAANVKALEATEGKLKTVVEDWKELLDEGEDTGKLVDSQKNGLGLHNADIERVSLTERDQEALAKAVNLSDLLDLRKEIILQQSGLRRACEDEMYNSRKDDVAARTRRQDHTTYLEEVAARPE
jgi:hypothetical protein